jgi:predicted nuclease of predicted toxin-antitoxin system
VRWLADACVPAALVRELRAEGHDASHMQEIAPRDDDEQVIDRANKEFRLLLTEDKDFGELVFRWGRSVPGVVLLRIDSERHHLKWTQLLRAVAQFGEDLFGRYTVIEESRFRSRPLLTVIRRE